jgi:release factor glutamine methyltransferase
MSGLGELLVEVAQQLRDAGLEGARREAEALVCGVLGLSRSTLVAHPEREVEALEVAAVRAAVARRSRREPLAYILGRREFWSVTLAVGPDVLVPRPSTEHLVEAVLARVAADESARLVDVGTGSGAIAVALALERPRVRVVATDVSEGALTVARRNVARHGLEGRVELRRGDLFEALGEADGPFDVIVSNPPYVPEGSVAELMPEVRDFEPVGALAAGPEGLSVLRRLIGEAGAWLWAGGWLVLEHGAGQEAEVAACLAEAGFVELAASEDYEGHVRVAVGRWPGGGGVGPRGSEAG